MSQAATWLVRMTSGETSAAQRREFARWRAAAPEHEEALGELKALWGEFGPVLQEQASARPRRIWATWAIAASVLIGLSLSLASWWQPPYDAVTSIGQQYALQLADGSSVTLNSNSAIRTHFSADSREIELDRGEVYVQVTPDTSRLFRVLSGESTIEVLGTRFSVQRIEGGSHIVVDSGNVRVRHQDDTVTLHAGQSVFARRNGLDAVIETDTARALAWRQGRLIFKDTPVPELIAELDRYTSDRLVVWGDHAQSVRLSAVVHIEDSAQWLDSLDGTRDLHVSRIGPLVIIR